MKETDAAWLAGYIDGDGCISLSSTTKRSQPLLHIDSCDRELLNRVAELCGGFVVIKTKYADHHRQAYTWRVRGADRVIEILREIRPFMRCAFKIGRADILLTEWRACTARNGHYTDEMKLAKVAMHKRFVDAGSGRGRRNHLTQVKVG